MRAVRRVATLGIATVITMATLGVSMGTANAAGTVPRYDHVLMVIMENHSAQNIIANPAAPYLNSLATSGASMTQSFAITHPSQPNYIALFSGALNGVVDNTCPNTLTAENLGSELIGAGLSFVGYSESLPSPGYTGCTSGPYARKHNPWVNFTTVPAASNQPLTSLPTDFSTLPTVSIVVPNLNNDMHDGTIGQADTWMRTNIDGYLQWAKQHNSLLLVTWDEDDNNAGNRIPTIFAGAGVRTGQYPERIDHYSVLRTLQDMYGLPPLANSATASTITDIWDTSPANQAPVPAFTGSCSQLVCSVDGTGSTDPDGSIASYTWDWGDGAAGNGPTAGHTFTTGGAKTVALLVTDNLGKTATVSRVLTATAPGGQPLAADAFGRTLTSGWGTADAGGAWAVGTASKYSVSAGLGRTVVTSGQTNAATLPSVSSTDSDLRVTTSVDRMPTGGGVYVGIIGRHTGTNSEYQARAKVRPDGTVGLSLLSLPGSATVTTLKSEVTVPGAVTTNSAAVKVRLQVQGVTPTTIRAKAWAATGTEPASWQLTATDSYPGLQAAGSVGMNAYLSSSSTVTPVTARFGDFSVLPTNQPTNQPPQAAFSGSCAVLTCSVDGGASADPDGAIASYSWAWGDGTVTTGVTSSHSYPAAGSHPVTLTVTDSAGAAAVVSHVLTATAPANAPPLADFSVTCTDLACAVDGGASVDTDGVVAGYSWNWGDGTQTTGATSTHSYPAAGPYRITLTVTDDDGVAASTGKDVVVTAPNTQPPLASFTVSCTMLACSVDGSASSDPDGSVLGYGWNWGDGAGTNGTTSTHDYLAAGTYTVTLTVTDDQGASGSATRSAVATAPPSNDPFAADAFARTVAAGWGTADRGGAWSLTGAGSKYSVNAGVASMTAKAGETDAAMLPAVSSSDTDIRVTLTADKLATGNGSYVGITGRRVGTNAEYQARLRLRADGTVAVSLLALNGSPTVIVLRPEVAPSGVSVAGGAKVTARVQVTSPTTFRMKVWPAAGTEPAAWQVSIADSTSALQARGAVGLQIYVSSGSTVTPVTLRASDLSARPTTGA